MAGAPFVFPDVQTVDAAGVPIAGARLFFYATGTSTPQPAYADAALTTPLLQPLIADERGAFGPVYLNSALAYKIVEEDADGAQIWTIDPVGWGWVQGQIDASVAVETARAEAAEAANAAALASALTAQSAVNTALSDAITAETARAEAAEAALAAEDVNLQNQIDALGGGGGAGLTLGGQVTIDSSGTFSVTFTPAFPTEAFDFRLANVDAAAPANVPVFVSYIALSKTGVTGVSQDNFGVPYAGTLNWLATGF
jgi:hypothetical protein